MSEDLPALGTGSASEQVALSDSPNADRSRGVWGGRSEVDGARQLRLYWQAVLRHRWVVIAATVLGLGAGLLAFRLVKPKYVAQGTIWVEVPQRGSADRGPIRTEQLLGSGAWSELLREPVVLDPAIRELRLFLEPTRRADTALFAGFGLKERFLPGRYVLTTDVRGDSVRLHNESAGGRAVETGAVGDSIGSTFGFGWLPPAGLLRPGVESHFTVVTPRDAALQLVAALRTWTDREGNFLRVELVGEDPHRVATTVNAVLERFVEVAAELKREKLTELVGILEEQLRDAEANLRSAEIALEEFRVRTITLPSERASPLSPGLEFTQDPVFKNFFDMRIELEAVRQDRDALGRALVQTGTGDFSPDAFEVIGAVQRSMELSQGLNELREKHADLRALRYAFTDEHPQVQRSREEISVLQRQTVPALAQALVTELTARERDLEERLRSASREIQQIPPRKIQESRLERDVAIAENLYTLLQQRFEEARLAEASSIPDVRILVPAEVPQRPASMQGLELLLASLGLGFGLGILGAVVLDRVDRRVRYPEQVTDEMGLSILGVIPHVRGLRSGRASGSSAPIVEALRGVRLNLVHAYGSAGPVVLTVTSPGAGDGKSFVASNLSLAFADAGHRTLLIDGDSRRGSLHRVLAADRKPGLTDCLVGRAAVDTCVQKTEYPLLHFLGGGTRMTAAPELLGSPQMVQLLTAMRSSYAVIIVDSPPLGAGVDAFTLGTVSGNMIIVLRTGATDRDESEAKLDLLDRLPVRVLGAVLNGVRDQKAYGYKYYSYYMPGYEHEIEEEDRLIKGVG